MTGSAEVMGTLFDGDRSGKTARLIDASLQVDDVLTELGPIQHPDKPWPHKLVAATKVTGRGKCSDCLTHATCCKEAFVAALCKTNQSLSHMHAQQAITSNRMESQGSQ